MNVTCKACKAEVRVVVPESGKGAVPCPACGVSLYFYRYPASYAGDRFGSQTRMMEITDALYRDNPSWNGHPSYRFAPRDRETWWVESPSEEAG